MDGEEELEKFGQPKGLPNPIKLFNDILDQGAHMTLCELALENKGIDPRNLRDARTRSPRPRLSDGCGRAPPKPTLF